MAVDYSEALILISAAGTSRAVLNLGIMHAKGLGAPQNLPEAIRLLEAVARPADSSDAFAARIEFPIRLQELQNKHAHTSPASTSMLAGKARASVRSRETMSGFD